MVLDLPNLFIGSFRVWAGAAVSNFGAVWLCSGIIVIACVGLASNTMVLLTLTSLNDSLGSAWEAAGLYIMSIRHLGD
jgi:hypothetical protein